MAMKYLEYEDKANNNEKAKAVDALSVLETMQELEEYNGSTAHKIFDNWYEIKRELRNIILTEVKKEEPVKKQ